MIRRVIYVLWLICGSAAAADDSDGTTVATRTVAMTIGSEVATETNQTSHANNTSSPQVLHLTETMAMARAEIKTLCADSLRLEGVNMAAKFLRLAFHDAVGSPDGCVDLQDPDNKGLAIPIAAIQPIVDRYTNNSVLSRADLWALAALTSVEQHSNGLEFPLYYYGRVDCDSDGRACRNTMGATVPCGLDTTATPDFHLPGPDLLTHELLDYFKKVFGFNVRQTIVAMGAHTFGVASRAHSGFDGGHGWVDRRNTFDNQYYTLLVGGTAMNEPSWVKIDNAPDWHHRRMYNTELPGDVPNRFDWVREKNENPNQKLLMLNSDMALTRNLTGRLDVNNVPDCDYAERDDNSYPRCPISNMAMIDTLLEFKLDNAAWLHEFRGVLTHMFSAGYTTHCSSNVDDEQKPAVASDYPHGKCLLLIDDTVRPPTMSPTVAPTLRPTTSPTTPKPTNATNVPATGTGAKTTPVNPSETDAASGGSGWGACVVVGLISVCLLLL